MLANIAFALVCVVGIFSACMVFTWLCYPDAFEGTIWDKFLP